MPDLIALAQTATLADFLQHYDASKVGKAKPSSGRTLLHAAVANSDLDARLAIANRLLDDGIDAAAIMLDPPYNALHILFGNHEHVWADEALLTARLIDGGADVNARAGKARTPVALLIDRGFAATPAVAPLIEVILERTAIDFAARVSFRGRPEQTLGEYAIAQTPPDAPLHRAALAATT